MGRSRHFGDRRWATPAGALLPLRGFLGVTFVYAGVQKLSDPGFLHPGASTYIGTQLRGFAHNTPGGFLLRWFAIPHPQVAGVGIAFVEIAIGLLVLTGLLTRAAAAAGLGLNLILFLTNSWHTSPYFLGSDIVFVFAWVPFVLAGANGQPALDHVLATGGGSVSLRTRSEAADATTRREALGRALAATGIGTLAIGGLAVLLKGRYFRPTPTLASRPQRTPAASPHPATTTSTSPATPHSAVHRSSAPPSNGVRLGQGSQLPRGQAALYTDPSDGRPDIIIRHPDGRLTALSAVCTHAGCTVGYQNGQIVCPCHGAQYDAQTGAVQGGPAPSPLPRRNVVERDGVIYAIKG